jgi:23S rRNA (uridine2552-2'-O)-methyltransferase
MTRRKPDKGWMARHVRDPYVQQAARQGYRSRAAFKLLEVDARDHLLRAGMRVLDLGAAPGGWSQVAAKRVGPTGLVVAADLAPMQPIAGVRFVSGDLRDPETRKRLEEALDGSRADLVLSDMAPNLSGVAASDEARAQELVESAVALCAALLKPDGALLVKMFHGSGLEAVIQRMRAVFKHVEMRKPPASRSRSSEVYVLCRGLAGR